MPKHRRSSREGDDRTDEAAQLAFSEGNAYRVRGREGGGEEDLQSAMDKYEKAKTIREENRTLDTPDGARLLYSLAMFYHQRLGEPWSLLEHWPLLTERRS